MMELYKIRHMIYGNVVYSTQQILEVVKISIRGQHQHEERKHQAKRKFTA